MTSSPKSQSRLVVPQGRWKPWKQWSAQRLWKQWSPKRRRQWRLWKLQLWKLRKPWSPAMRGRGASNDIASRGPCLHVWAEQKLHIWRLWWRVDSYMANLHLAAKWCRGDFLICLSWAEATWRLGWRVDSCGFLHGQVFFNDKWCRGDLLKRKVGLGLGCSFELHEIIIINMMPQHATTIQQQTIPLAQNMPQHATTMPQHATTCQNLN